MRVFSLGRFSSKQVVRVWFQLDGARGVENPYVEEGTLSIPVPEVVCFYV